MPGGERYNPDPTGKYPGRKLEPIANVYLPPLTVAAVAYQAGFRGSQLRTAVAVSFAENGTHNATAQNLNSNGSVDTGLWQINSVHGISIRQLFDPQINANAAYNISGGGRDWSPWSTYPLQSNLRMAEAAGVIRSLQQHGGAVTWLRNNPLGDSGEGIKGAVNSPNLLQQAENSTPLGAIVNFLGKLTDSHTWYRIFQVIIGGLFLLFGIYKLATGAGFEPPSVVPV